MMPARTCHVAAAAHRAWARQEHACPHAHRTQHAQHDHQPHKPATITVKRRAGPMRAGHALAGTTKTYRDGANLEIMTSDVSLASEDGGEADQSYATYPFDHYTSEIPLRDHGRHLRCTGGSLGCVHGRRCVLQLAAVPACKGVQGAVARRPTAAFHAHSCLTSALKPHLKPHLQTEWYCMVVILQASSLWWRTLSTLLQTAPGGWRQSPWSTHPSSVSHISPGSLSDRSRCRSCGRG